MADESKSLRGNVRRRFAVRADSTGERGRERELVKSPDFAKVLGYTDYRNFEQVVEKARLACFNSGQRVDDHFVDITEMVGIGSATPIVLSKRR